MAKHRVVITGLGAVTPIGVGVDAYWNGLVEGKSGSAPITLFDASNHETKFACEVKGFDFAQWMDPREGRRYDRYCQFAVAAAEMAIQDANLQDWDGINKDLVGVIIGSGIGGLNVFEEQTKILFERGPKRLSPFFIPMMISDIAAGIISIRYGIKGVNYAVTSACATASHAIGVAYRHLQFGDADIILCGGSEAAVTSVGVGGFNAMKALSTRNEAPEKASRPFDKHRDGFVIGEGAGVLVLETLEMAERRNAKIYGEIIGIGFTGDAHHITAPAEGGEGAQRSMRLAIQESGLAVDEFGYINAHGTSTPYNDKFETMAVKAVFGDHAKKLAISSTKSMTGHLLGAAGGIELIATVLAVKNGILPPTINYETPDEECDLDYVPNRSRVQQVDAALSNTFGFGGHNATIAVKRWNN
ncbi:MAG: beta-ketoacyl-ACP synthase II [bacterium]|nr:beta-ketoacyl-ACP synthase II [bacterium]